MKIVSIDTPGPSLNELYVYINPVSGKPYLYNGTFSDESVEYAFKARTSADVVEMTLAVYDRLKEAMASDTALSEHFDKLINAGNNSSQ